MPPKKDVSDQMLADFLTGGTSMSYARRENGALSVVAQNGKKFLFSVDQVNWAISQLTKPTQAPSKPSKSKPAAKKAP